MICAKCNNPTIGKSKYCKVHRAESRQNFKAMISEKAAEKESRNAEFQQWLDKANEAGREAAESIKPAPMGVIQHSDPLDDNSPVINRWVVNDGVCGFAWVHISPATTSFARWLMKEGKARSSYYGGIDIPIRSYNQSYERKVAHANAMAKSLRGKGIEAYSDGRLD